MQAKKQTLCCVYCQQSMFILFTVPTCDLQEWFGINIKFHENAGIFHLVSNITAVLCKYHSYIAKNVPPFLNILLPSSLSVFFHLYCPLYSCPYVPRKYIHSLPSCSFICDFFPHFSLLSFVLSERSKEKRREIHKMCHLVF